MDSAIVKGIHKTVDKGIYISFHIFQTRYNFMQFIYFWKTALHVSGGSFTHHQEHIPSGAKRAHVFEIGSSREGKGRRPTHSA